MFGLMTLHAQSDLAVEAVTTIAQNNIRIGEPTQLRLSVRYREGTGKVNVTWPILKDSLIKGVEISSRDSIRINLLDRTSVLYEQSCSYTITSFEPGTYKIPGFTFNVEGEKVTTKPVELYVTTVQIDTTKPIKDIKTIFEVPPAPPRPEISKPFPWWMVAVGGLVAIGIAFILWLVLRKKSPPAIIPKQPVYAHPHERVLDELAALERQQLWKQPDQLKAYHTRLTEILREWTVERFTIPALEMTTAEIVQHLRYKQVDETPVLLLRDILRMADTVKFAKNIPGDEDNERSLSIAQQFVQSTAFPAPQIQQTIAS